MTDQRTTKPKVVFKGGDVGHLVRAGDEVSLIYLPAENREQYYPNKWFRPASTPIQPRQKRPKP